MKFEIDDEGKLWMDLCRKRDRWTRLEQILQAVKKAQEKLVNQQIQDDAQEDSKKIAVANVAGNTTSFVIDTLGAFDFGTSAIAESTIDNDPNNPTFVEVFREYFTKKWWTRMIGYKECP